MPKEYHIKQFAPTLPNWPNGGWDLYKITGAQIAERTVWQRNEKNKLEICERHPWCGFIGCFAEFDDVVKAIKEGREPD